MSHQDDIEYYQVNLPDPEEKPYEEWSVDERRAYLLRQVFYKGCPQAITQVDMAKKFNVSQVTIHNDLEVVVEYWNESLDGNEFKKFIHDLYLESLDNAEPGTNVYLKHIEKFEKFGETVGILDIEPDKHEIEHKGDISFNLVKDDEED